MGCVVLIGLSACRLLACILEAIDSPCLEVGSLPGSEFYEIQRVTIVLQESTIYVTTFVTAWVVSPFDERDRIATLQPNLSK